MPPTAAVSKQTKAVSSVDGCARGGWRSRSTAKPHPERNAAHHQYDNGTNPAMTASLALARLRDQDLRRCRWGLDFRRHSATMHSTMLRVKVDHDEDVALHDQVAGEIRRAIADGEAGPGERLPPAKDLAAVLGVNANTVFFAPCGFCVTRVCWSFAAGRGVTVAGTPEKSAVLSRARELVESLVITAIGEKT